MWVRIPTTEAMDTTEDRQAIEDGEWTPDSSDVLAYLDEIDRLIARIERSEVYIETLEYAAGVKIRASDLHRVDL